MSWFKAALNWLWETFKVAWPLWGATAVTVGFARWVYLLANEVTVQEPYRATRWEHFLHGRPNELGDTLAGFVGSLTLIWVVASVIQQSMELKAQRQEFGKMLEIQDEQLKSFKAQTWLLQEERRMKMEASADQLSEVYIQGLRARFVELSGLLAWRGLREPTMYFFDGAPEQKVEQLISLDFQTSAELPEHYIGKVIEKLNEVAVGHEVFGGSSFYGMSDAKSHLSSLLEHLREISDNAGFVSSQQKQKLDNYGIYKLEKLVEKLISADLWAPEGEEGITP